MAKLNCIIVDPDLSSRMRLKQATTPITEFGAVLPLSSFHEARGHLEGERQLDVVFLSSKLPQNELSGFISNARTTRQGQDTAYVIIVRSAGDGNNNQAMASNMMQGGDGVLFEPYSVDSLLEMTLLASRVRKERSGARERIALGIMVKELINQLDLVACLKANDCEPGLSIKKLKEMGEVLEKMNDEQRAMYFEVMEKAFIDAPMPPKALAVKKYGGVSSRVKKKMEAKLVAAAAKPPTEG